MNFMDLTRAEFYKELEKKASSNDCYNKECERLKREMESTKMMASMRDDKVVKEKKIQAVHVNSALIPKLKRNVNKCYVAEFLQSQIKEKKLNKNELYNNQRSAKWFGTLDLKNPTDEEVRNVKCRKQETLKYELIKQIENNQQRKMQETFESMKNTSILRNIEIQRIKEEERKLVENKLRLRGVYFEQRSLRLDYIKQEEAKKIKDLFEGENKSIVDLMKPKIKSFAQNSYTETVKNKIRKTLEKMEEKKTLTENARIEYSYLKNEDIQRMPYYKTMDTSKIDVETSFKNKEIQKSLQVKKNQKIKTNGMATQIGEKRLKEEKKRAHRKDLVQQAKENYVFLNENNIFEREMFRKAQKVHDEFKELEENEMQKLNLNLSFESEFGIVCKPCLIKTTNECSLDKL